VLFPAKLAILVRSFPLFPHRHAHCTARCTAHCTQGYFTFWVILSITWGLLATIVSTVLPLWESRDSLWNVIKNVFTCAAPTPEEEMDGTAEPGDFARQVRLETALKHRA
jgi:hypothetical protein